MFQTWVEWVQRMGHFHTVLQYDVCLGSAWVAHHQEGVGQHICQFRTTAWPALERSTLRVACVRLPGCCLRGRSFCGRFQMTSVSLSPPVMRSTASRRGGVLVTEVPDRGTRCSRVPINTRARHHREPGPLLIDNTIVIAHSSGHGRRPGASGLGRHRGSTPCGGRSATGSGGALNTVGIATSSSSS
jgi:hypothetical protein